MSNLIMKQGTLDRLAALVANTKSDSTALAYKTAIQDFQAWTLLTGHGFDREGVLAYAQHLKNQDYANATINQRLSALRVLATEIRYAPGVAAADQATAEGIVAVKNLPRRGRRLGHWLDNGKANQLMSLPDRSTLRGKQQFAVIALLLGAALRREEAAELRMEQIQERDDQWLIVDLEGKGDKTRSVPLAPWVVDALQEWTDAAGITEGKVLRAVNCYGNLTGRVRTKGGGMTDGGMSAQAVYNMVKELAADLGIPDLGPHSLRRTWAKRAYKMGYPLDQISLVLGHASLKTTEIYLGLNHLDVDNPVHVTF